MASSVSAPKRLPVATDGIVLIHADFLITGIVMTFIGPMLPILAARWSLTDAQSGSLIFVQFFSSMFGMLVSGLSVQRLGYRTTLIIGSLLMASGMALLASGSWGVGIVAVCILGIGYGITTPAGNLRTAEINPESSASALNVINAVWGIGAMSSPFLVAVAQREHHSAYFLYGTAAALLVLIARAPAHKVCSGHPCARRFGAGRQEFLERQRPAPDLRVVLYLRRHGNLVRRLDRDLCAPRGFAGPCARDGHAVILLGSIAAGTSSRSGVLKVSFRSHHCPSGFSHSDVGRARSSRRA